MIAIQSTNSNYDGRDDTRYPSQNKNMKRRVVRFSPTIMCRIKNTISINDMTDEEIANTWIQKDEGDEIIQQCHELIAVVNQLLVETTDIIATNQIIGNSSSMRGLESHTKYGKKRTKLNRYKSKMIVLDEQDQQYVEDRLDEEEIASIYKEVCNESQIHAELLAKQDRMEVERYCKIHKSTATTTITTAAGIRSSTGVTTMSKTIASAA